jgi:hypothetical protein
MTHNHHIIGSAKWQVKIHLQLLCKLWGLTLWTVLIYTCTFMSSITWYSPFGHSLYKGCPESIHPFWISRKPVRCSWSNLAANQRRPYCASMDSHFPVGLVSWQWDAVEWACVLCDHLIQNDQASSYSLITKMHLPILHLSCRLFWHGITSPRSVTSPSAHIYLPATSGFSQS